MFVLKSLDTKKGHLHFKSRSLILLNKKSMENNQKIYKIAEEKINKLALDRSIKFMSLAFIAPILLVLFFKFKLGINNNWIFLFFTGMVVYYYCIQKTDLQFLRFLITDHYISQTFDKSKSNQFFEYLKAARRSKGVNNEKTILYTKIESVAIKQNGDIVIKSTEHDFIFKDATITIPAQIEDYEIVKNLIQKKYAKKL